LIVHSGISSFKNISSPVITVGTFDGVHVGHQKILNKIRTIANNNNGETALLTFDPHPRKVLFNSSNSLKLINTLDEKINLLSNYGLDHLIIHPFNKDFSRITPTSYVRDLLVNQLNVATLVIGYNHQFGRNREGDITLLHELSEVYNFNVQEINAEEINEIKVSSTKIREALSMGDILQANNYLGHDFTLSGEVIEGNKIGRSIGFPTANISIKDEEKIIPANGVYAVKVKLNDQCFNGMMNIGNRPTIEETNKSSIEVHIFDFSDNIYGLEIEIVFKAHIRKEEKFSDIDTLKKQLINDQKAALDLLL
tara:strand:+ start:326 stop:1255 length:930 start_codon:yes stop_codon:yes gene_type:complete